MDGSGMLSRYKQTIVAVTFSFSYFISGSLVLCAQDCARVVASYENEGGISIRTWEVIQDVGDPQSY